MQQLMFRHLQKLFRVFYQIEIICSHSIYILLIKCVNVFYNRVVTWYYLQKSHECVANKLLEKTDIIILCEISAWNYLQLIHRFYEYASQKFGINMRKFFHAFFFKMNKNIGRLTNLFPGEKSLTPSLPCQPI